VSAEGGTIRELNVRKRQCGRGELVARR
jgi:hypothetical protein